MNKNLIVSLVCLIVLIGGSYMAYQQLTTVGTKKSPSTNQTFSNTIELNSIEDESFNIEFENEQGEKVLLDSYVGRPIVLNFWASWCPPCREEMPIFAEQQLINPDIVFLYINQTDGIRETKEKARGFLKNEGLSMPVQFDETSDSAIKFGLTALPSTYFIDAKGNIRNRAMGALSKETLVSAITELMDNK